MVIGMRDGSLGSKMVGAAIATGAALAVYLLYIRPRHIRWGDPNAKRPYFKAWVAYKPTGKNYWESFYWHS
jgi:hypothetical protein